MQILDEADFRVATMDIRGHCESGRDWPSYGQIAKAAPAEAEAMADDLTCPAEIAMKPDPGHYPPAQAAIATGAAISRSCWAGWPDRDQVGPRGPFARNR
jgi:hypothetical protein